MTLDGTRTFIVGRTRPAVIDPGPDLAAHVDALVEELAGATPLILLTHSHPDHAAAAADLAARTGGPTLGYPALRTAAALATDAGEIRVIETPGHTPDHLSFHWVPERGEDALFVGDAFMGGMDTVMVAPPEGDLEAYLETLAVIERLAPARLFPAHGEPIPDGAAAARRYRAHRMERIGQVVRALGAGGPANPADLVDAIYGADLDRDLRGAAIGSLEAIVEHLARSGRATRDAQGRVSLL